MIDMILYFVAGLMMIDSAFDNEVALTICFATMTILFAIDMKFADIQKITIKKKTDESKG